MERSGLRRPKVARRVSKANQFIAYAVQDKLKDPRDPDPLHQAGLALGERIHRKLSRQAA